MSLTFKDLRKANVERCESAFHRVEEWSPTDWATALAGEVGEACNLVKKLRRLHGPTNPGLVAMIQTTDSRELVEGIAKELADAVIYADLLAARLGIDLGYAVVSKFNEVSDRVHSDLCL